jgi:Na+/H+-dicarboxylate symporter
LLTTVLASALAALLFECFPPPFRPGALYPPVGFRLLTQFFCLSHDDGLWFVRSGNVAGIVLFSLLLGIAFGHVSPKDREVPQKFFDGLLSAILQMTRWMIRGIPLAIVCFVVSIGKELRSQKLGGWGHYLLLVLGSYLLQALVVWPLLLKWNGISPIKSACKAFKTLSFAFFSRSSVATIPAILRCLEVDFRIPPRISRISVPLGATLALSGCAGFIWITVVFVAQSQGIMFTRMDKILWILISAIAAVIHSGMPMGCLLVSTTLLVAIGVPIEPMSLLLPFHGLLDMFEAAVNTWSNICVALVVRESRTLLPAANDG